MDHSVSIWVKQSLSLSSANNSLASFVVIILIIVINISLFSQAAYFIFEKLKQEGFAGNDDVRLRTTILVPRSMVGRVIGKGGKNVSMPVLTRVHEYSGEKSSLSKMCLIGMKLSDK